MAGKVVFGFKNVHYALFDPKTDKYGAVKAFKGAVSASLKAEGDSSDFWADDSKFATFTSNGGYTGTMEMAYADAAALTDLLGYEKDDNGAIIEFDDAVTPSVALMYEVSSNVSPDRFVFYDVQFGRPDIAANTKSDSTKPDTVTFNVTILPHEVDFGGVKRNAVVCHITNDPSDTKAAAAYATFMDNVYMPTKASA